MRELTDLAAKLRTACTGVLLGAATGSEEIQVEAINRLLAAAREAAAALEAAREDAWHTMESCPVNRRVLLWNQDEGEMFFGHKPDDAPTDDAVIVSCTAAYADAWRPLPSEPEHETYDGPPQLSVVPAIDQARGKGVSDEA